MTYCICDQDGYVGDLATTQGLWSLYESIKNIGPVSKAFVAEGNTENIDGLIAELKGVTNPDKDINSTILNLVNLAGKSIGIMIVTDGAGEDDGSPDTTDEEIEAHLMKIPEYAANPGFYNPRMVKKNTYDPVKESLKRIPAWRGKL